MTTLSAGFSCGECGHFPVAEPFHVEETGDGDIVLCAGCALQKIIVAVRHESGIREGCPLCGGHFDHSSGQCDDCGIDILRDWQLGAKA